MNATAAKELRGALKEREPMSRHTSWRVGGPADRWYEPADIDDLCAFLATLPEDEPLHWHGLGSNLLVRDGGIRGTVVSIHGVLDQLERVDDTSVRVGAGVHCARLAKQCAKWQLGPATFFAGIPGTVGGALAMNAGAYGGETWDDVVKVETVDRCGQRHVRERAEYTIAYRSVGAPAEEWFLSATLGLEADPDASIIAIKELLEKRRAAQPIGKPSCGSVFRNPEGDHAARLIEATGLKGYRIGGAQVSEKHANFIINTGEASAADVEALIEHVISSVESAHGVRLHREVRIVGEGA